MLHLKTIQPEHEALMGLVIQKINELSLIQQSFEDTEDKFLANFALKNAGLYMANLIINGVPKVVKEPNAPLNEPNPAMGCQNDGTIGDAPDSPDAA